MKERRWGGAGLLLEWYRVKPMAPDATKTAPDLAALLDTRTAEGTLLEPLDGGKLRCLACGHRCVIFPGHRGICQVRFNVGGTLRVPWGYVATLQCDPTEKKPFYHVLPGSKTLTFGMLGCDLHCPYCLTPEMRVVTNRGVLPIAEVFAQSMTAVRTPTGEVARPTGLRAVTARGDERPVVQVFKHRYVGRLIVVEPYYLPTFRCTPEHRVFATTDPGRPPEEIEATRLTERHYLAVPRHYHTSSAQVVDVREALSEHRSEFETPHGLPAEPVERVMLASAAGMASPAIGLDVGRSASHVRHVRRNVGQGLWTDRKSARLSAEGTTVRFSKEHRPGVAATIPLDENFARLLGYYCAEGSVHTMSRRPNSYALTFAFGPHEADLVEETRGLITSVLGLPTTVRVRPTSQTLTVANTSAALLFRSLCGTGATAKHVPRALFDAPRPVVEAFLDAFILGDGRRHTNGKVTATTKSADLAYGVSWLGLKTGRFASLYETPAPRERSIAGRRVKQSPRQYTVVWYDNPTLRRRLVVQDAFYLVPIRSLATADYDGDVFNMEVEEEHNYLANFILVANCQNYVTSQALRDPAAGFAPDEITAEQIVRLGLRHGARLVGSSYNEPLITTEWAVEVFKASRAAGLRTCFISNGNATREALAYLRPWLDCYKIDLKSMNPKNYRALGGVLDRVLDTIRMVYEMGFWTEIVTLVIPGWNDSDAELRSAAEFIASVSPDIPWHVTAFHADYKMLDYRNTPASTLVRAARLGEAAGLRYVYAGNLPGQVGPYEHTFCPLCRALLVERYGFVVLRNRLAATGGTCPDCGAPVPGIWNRTHA